MKHDGEVGRVAEQREGFEEGFVFGGEDVAAVGNVFEAAILDAQAANRFEQPTRGRTPQSRQEENAVATAGEHRQAEDHQGDEVEVEGDVEDERAELDHDGASGEPIEGAAGGGGGHSRLLSWRKTISRDSRAVSPAMARQIAAIAA